MSRLTRAPFHKPSLHDIPRPVHPLSPPDTEDSLPLNFHPVSREASSSDLSMSFVTKVDPTDQYQTLPVDASTSTPKVFRRPSTLNYVHSGAAREGRSAPRPATRWLIVVVPPPSVSRNAQTSTLFLNPANRASHGILLPLLPSLSGQLTSIAREYAFPSTSGICIYLNVNDNGLGMDFSLRVSDDSWPILWSNALGLDERQQQQPPSVVGLGGLPIAGRIEFDLDLRKARWFESWVTACRRNSDAGIPTVPSVRHYRGESRTSVTHDQPEESIPDDVSVTIQQKVPVVRHIPRKLSLLDRVDTQTHHSSLSRPASRNGFTFPQHEGQRLTVPVLTPVDGENETMEDEEEPQTASQRVERKIENWRASSTFAASPLAATTGQTALEPANMPNTLVLDTPSDAVDLAEESGEDVLNLDDFTWSISSAGPSTGPIEPDSALFANWRTPSVHLAERLEGSVCLTPSTATSWGAPDYDPLSPAMSLALRLPSPDIAARIIEDAPLTPMTATSWGAPSEWPASPASVYRAPSVDLGARCLDSRPATPSTATSWGAPLEWPESPATPYYVTTPDIGQMVFDEDDVVLSHPSLATENWRHVWPYTEESHGEKPVPGWYFVWPYFTVDGGMSSSHIRTTLDPGYPYINPYAAAYPNFDLYPTVPEVEGVTRGIDMSLNASYPNFCIYPATYPAFEIYPGYVVQPQEIPMKSLSVKLDVNYPSIELYAPVYPHFDIYPAKPTKSFTPVKSFVSSKSRSAPSRPVVVALDYNYPAFNLYPAVYPENLQEIYPTQIGSAVGAGIQTVITKLAHRYPHFDIYPAVYPHFDLYPSKATSIASASRTLPVVPSERVVYPHFDLYPPVQGRASSGPPVSEPASHRQSSVVVRLAPKYPHIEIYPSVYPDYCIYPHVVSPPSKDITAVECEARYPNFDIYPAVYPYFDIYRTGSATFLDNWREPKSLKLDAKYPAFSVYSPVYPYFDIYNTGTPTVADVPLKEINIRLTAAYPAFNIYSPVYPHFDIYNTGFCTDVTPLYSRLSTRLDAQYPAFDIYPAVYPHFQLYPFAQPSMQTTRPRVRKTHRELHDLVMSRLPVSSAASSQPSSSLLSSRDRRPRRTHEELHDMIFPNGLQPTVVSSSPSSLPSRTSPKEPQVRLGLPVRPSEIRRTVSLNRATRSPSERENVLSRSGSLKKLAPVEEMRALPVDTHRTTHGREHSESHSEGSPVRRKARRDSIVLEKARHWGAGVSPAETIAPDRLTMNELSDFPMPPPPPLPNKLSGDLNRPIAKLDRSKFPFQ